MSVASPLPFPPVPPLHLRHSVPALGCALVMGALALLTVFGDDGLVCRHMKVRELGGFQQEIQGLDEDIFQFRVRIRGLRDRPIALERSAASVLLMARPDAVIYHFPQEETPGVEAAQDGTAPPAETGEAGRRSP